jgi:hypothetical protein
LLLPSIRVLAVSVRKARVLRDATAWGSKSAIETMVAYQFTVSIMKHRAKRFASFYDFIFLFHSLAILLYLLSFVKWPAFSPHTAQ